MVCCFILVFLCFFSSSSRIISFPSLLSFITLRFPSCFLNSVPSFHLTLFCFKFSRPLCLALPFLFCLRLFSAPLPACLYPHRVTPLFTLTFSSHPFPLLHLFPSRPVSFFSTPRFSHVLFLPPRAYITCLSSLSHQRRVCVCVCYGGP